MYEKEKISSYCGFGPVPWTFSKLPVPWSQA
jgi:hypothetical protein